MRRLTDELDEGPRDFGEYMANYMTMEDNLYNADKEEAILQMMPIHGEQDKKAITDRRDLE